MSERLEIKGQGAPFRNHTAYCVGTGRLGLALQKEYQEHLELVQKAIRFQYIRGHGLFCRDVGIYREYECGGRTVPFYNFTYLDRIFDSYLQKGIRPFIELGFMPEELASGEQTIFYWKGNVTPPKDYEKWEELIRQTLLHCVERYGAEEVRNWPVEVWNEPNIGFWTGGLEGYFRLYESSVRAVKSVDPQIQVGGPAICGVEVERWLTSFFSFCSENHVPLDFVTRHCYTANTPRNEGHYVYHTMRDPRVMLEELRETREIMARYPLTKGLPLHITEFNSSYNPLCPVHDSVFNAAYLARILSEAGEYAESYSYWTFSDVFEECDVPKAPFAGGFGLVALNGIKKPSFHVFRFFSQAGKTLLYRDENMLVTADRERYVILAWSFYDPRDGAQPPAPYERELSLPSFGGRAFFTEERVNERFGNPEQAWYDMGMPRSLTEKQVSVLKHAAEPAFSHGMLEEKDGKYSLSLSIRGNEFLMIEIVPRATEPQEYLGFDRNEFYGLSDECRQN